MLVLAFMLGATAAFVMLAFVLFAFVGVILIGLGIVVYLISLVFAVSPSAESRG